MASCFPLGADINGSSCEQIVNFDFGQEGIAWSYENTKTKTKDSNNRTIYTNIVLDAGTKAYKLYFRVIKPLDDLKETTEEKPFGNTYKVEGKIIIKGRTPDAALQKFKLDNDRLVICVPQAAQTGAARQVLFGIESGLKPMAGDTFTKEMGGYAFNFMADFLSVPQNFLYATSDAGTDALIASLLDDGNQP